MAMKIGYYFVPLPEAIWNDNLQLTLGEFRLLGYLLKHQVGFSKKPELITDDELLHGIKGKNGERLDHGCGIKGVNNLKDARRRLLERDWIALKEDLSDKARPKRFYRVKIDPTTPSSSLSETDTQLSEVSAQIGHPSYPKRTPQLSGTDTRTNKEYRPITDPSDPLPVAAAKNESKQPGLVSEGEGVKAEIASKPQAERDTPHHRLYDAYVEALGYKPPTPPREGKAIKALLRDGYTQEQVLACYRGLKNGADGFWKDKHLSLQVVHERIGAWLQANPKAGQPEAEQAQQQAKRPPSPELQRVQVSPEESERMGLWREEIRRAREEGAPKYRLTYMLQQMTSGAPAPQQRAV